MAHGTEDAVVTVDVETRTVVDVTPLAGRPEQLLVMRDGRVLATLRGSGELALLEANATGHLEETKRVHVGSDPFAVAASPDEERLYVTCGHEGSIVALDGSTFERVRDVAVAREPRGILVSADGHRVFASHATAPFVTSIDVEYPGAPRVQRAPLGVEEQEFLIGPGLVTTGFVVDQGFAIVERAGRIYVPGAFKDPGPHELTGGYGAHAAPIRPTVRTVDMVAFAPVSNGMGVSRFSDVGNECTLPRAAALDDAEHLYVACLGIDQVLELDARSVDPSTGLMRRFDVPEGPTGVAVDGARRQLVTYSSIAGAVGFVDLDGGETVELGLPMRVEPTLSAAEKRGRHLFSTTRDARIALDNRACESCHPDGRDDGMTWSTPDGPRQTISLAGRISGPGHFGWFGDNGTVALHVRHTAKRLHGAGFEGGGTNAQDLAAIEAWLHAMPAPSPTVAADDPAAIEGARIFAARGCNGCHRDGATDDRAHDVHTGNVEEASLRFDTPSLRLVSASAPYFHDGRFATLDAMFLSDKGPMAMPGSTAEERSAVSRYLASLGSKNVRP
ncbi:MAG TPA: hypothetical protein VL400_05985, partial [Polyangiaceae bacterium]|nr:hypothetical protein [Polyangiaceae bacterium]